MSMRRVALALSLIVLVAGAMAAPAEAAKPRKFRQAQTCAWYMPPEFSPDLALNLDVAAGRWFNDAGDESIPCYDQMYDDFRPTVRGGFTATVRWYVGKKRVLKQRRYVRNAGFTNSESSKFEFDHKRLRMKGKQAWVGKRRVVARVTFTKKGYRPARIRARIFMYPSE